MSNSYGLYSMGNALLDYEIEVTPDFLNEMEVQKGAMTLVDQNRQSFLLETVDGHQHKRTCGGSAANSVIAFSQLGGTAYYSCKVANDEAGEFYLKALSENGVDSIQEKNDGMTGKCLVFVTPDADRTMNTYLGISAGYGIEQINTKSLLNSKYLYVEGYLATSPNACAAVEATMNTAFEKMIPIALTFSDPFIVSTFKEQFKSWLTRPIDLIFCNEEEAYSFTESSSTESIEDVGQKLLKYSKKFAITRGAKGAFLYDGDKEIVISTTQVKPVDTNGAGDLFAGAFLWAISNKLSFVEAGRLATTLASQLVTQFGARLTLEQVTETKKEVLGE